MNPIAVRDIPHDGGALTRFGPNTTARLLEVILFRSHRSITYYKRKKTNQKELLPCFYRNCEYKLRTLDKNCTMYLRTW